MIIDSHAHVFMPDSAEYPWDRAMSNPPTFSAPFESLIAAMGSAHVDKAVLIQHSCYGYDNRYILDCAARYPDRFCTVIKVDPLGNNSAPELQRLVEVPH